MGMGWLAAYRIVIKVAAKVPVIAAAPWDEHGFSGAGWWNGKRAEQREARLDWANQPVGREITDMRCA